MKKMKQKNTDPQTQRKKDAIHSATFSSSLMLISGLALLLLRQLCGVSGFGGAMLLILALLDFGAIAPVWILLKTRLKEIEGGEEDAAAQY